MPTTPLGLLITCSIGAAAALLLLLSAAEDALAGLSYAAAQSIPPAQLRRLRRAVRNLSQALEEFEQALGSGEQQPHEEEQEEEDSKDGAAAAAPTTGDQLLSMREVCQELGMGKSWVYRRIRTKEIPSIKLGHNIKVRRQDLEEYLKKAPRYRSPEE